MAQTFTPYSVCQLVAVGDPDLLKEANIPPEIIEQCTQFMAAVTNDSSDAEFNEFVSDFCAKIVPKDQRPKFIAFLEKKSSNIAKECVAFFQKLESDDAKKSEKVAFLKAQIASIDEQIETLSKTLAEFKTELCELEPPSPVKSTVPVHKNDPPQEIAISSQSKAAENSSETKAAYDTTSETDSIKDSRELPRNIVLTQTTSNTAIVSTNGEVVVAILVFLTRGMKINVSADKKQNFVTQVWKEDDGTVIFTFKNSFKKGVDYVNMRPFIDAYNRLLQKPSVILCAKQHAFRVYINDLTSEQMEHVESFCSENQWEIDNDRSTRTTLNIGPFSDRDMLTLAFNELQKEIYTNPMY